MNKSVVCEVVKKIRRFFLHRKNFFEEMIHAKKFFSWENPPILSSHVHKNGILPGFSARIGQKAGSL